MATSDEPKLSPKTGPKEGCLVSLVFVLESKYLTQTIIFFWVNG